MKMMCKLKRPQGTQVTLGGETYDFQPDAHGRHVCVVEREDHQDIFLAIPEGYRPLIEDGEPARVEGQVPAEAQTLAPGAGGDDEGDDEDERVNSGQATEADTTEATTPVDNGEETDEEVDLEALGDDALAALYEDVMGRKPNAKAKRETLIGHIVEQAGS